MKSKKKLYKEAVEAYYSGEERISDTEFDTLEEELGLKNKILGSSHSNNYTIKHPVILGSLRTDPLKDELLGDSTIKKYVNTFTKNINILR